MALVNYLRRSAKAFLLARTKVFCCSIVFFLNAFVLNAQTPDEYQVEAVFIYNFTRFVKWPPQAFGSSSSPFIIGIFGKNVGTYLEESVEGEKIEGHPIRVRYLADAGGVEECHIIFIEKTHASVIEKIVAESKNKPILTISDHESFMKASGMIRLYLDNNRIRMEINQKKSEESKLDISAKLLSLATIYRSR